MSSESMEGLMEVYPWELGMHMYTCPCHMIMTLISNYPLFTSCK